MLRRSVQIGMSEYQRLYDIVVEKGHFLRKVREEIDFSFVNDLLRSSYCEHIGRPAKEPELIFKILFLKKLYDYSDEALIEQIRVNMAYKYFLDMKPEDEPVDSSLLTKFRKTRVTQDILEDMLKETIRQAIKKGLVKSTAIIVDSTHTLARYKNQSPTEILRKLTKELRYQIYQTDYDLSEFFPEKPSQLAELKDEIEYTQKLAASVQSGIKKSKNQKAKELLKKIEGLLQDEKINQMQRACDEEARTGHKSADDRFFGFKNHIAMTEERLITAITVTDGAAGDGKQLPDLIKQSKDNGILVTEIIGDTAYSSQSNIDDAKEQKIAIISKLNSVVSSIKAKDKEGFEFNKDAGTYVCPNGCLAKYSKEHDIKQQRYRFRFWFDKKTCNKCPFQKECKISTKTHSFKITVPCITHQEQYNFQNTDYFKMRYRQRYMIEAKNSEAKNCHGLGRADSKGIRAMNVQSYFTAFALNIKRILKLSGTTARNCA